MSFDGTPMPDSPATSAVTPKFYRVTQVADQLDVHRTTVYRAIKSGDLRAVRFGQGRGGLRVSAAALAEYLASAQVRSADLVEVA
jgi:excisionase family DNA binding protein